MNWRDPNALAQSMRDYQPGAKFKRRKGRYMRGPWLSRTKENRTMFNRRERHKTKQKLHG
jgi:hypothetical protein